jgi:ATP-binding cassette subfamily B protein/subfamily B ATP-binding cassette protein MsbA
MNIASGTLSAIAANRIQADLRRDIYGHIQRLPLTFFDQSRQGDLLALMTWEVAQLSSFISGTLTAIPGALLTAGGALVILFMLDPVVALIVPVLVPSYYVTLKLVGRRLRSLAKAVQEAEASVFANAEEALEILPAIKAFTREESSLRIYSQRVEQARALRVRQDRINAALGPILGLLTGTAAIAILLLAGQSVGRGATDNQQLFSFLLYAALLTRPVSAVVNLYGQLQTARGTLGRLQRVLQQNPERGYSATFRHERCRGAVSFRDVHFAYPGREGTLKGASFDIAPGEVVALTGENGAGKSTLVSLLMRFYLPEQGQIALDGLDISLLNLTNMRGHIGYVPQRAFLFNATVKENIQFGLNCDLKKIEEACDLAQAREFISALPYGFDTHIGDHGVRLSGGQRQRIALARALLSDPPILILDEATSMYDLAGEAAFVEACKTALVGRTVILITHRPASLALADRTLTVIDGKVVAASRFP